MKYFPVQIKQYNLIKDQFTKKPLSNSTIIEKEQIINISYDFSLQMKFTLLSFLGFWNNIRDE